MIALTVIPGARGVVMYKGFRRGVTVWAVLALFAPVFSCAKEFADADTREVSSYVLTEQGLEQFTQATKNLGSLAQELFSDCNDSDDSDDSETPQSLGEMVARMDAIPGVTAAIESAGMSNREYIVFSFSLFKNAIAAWVMSQPGGELPPDVSMANVEFYQAHEAEIQQISPQMESGGCDDEDENYDEEEEEWSDSDR